MKKIGLVGGTSWTSTVDYYKFINEEVNKQLGGLNYAECILYSVNFNDFHACNSAHDWDGAYRLFKKVTNKLCAAGAEMILLCANTAHINADRLAAELLVPLIDIRTETAKVVLAKNIQKVGLLGTVYTMQLDFYKDKLQHHGIDTVIPQSAADVSYIEETLLYELGKGIIKEETKKQYLRIIDELIDQGAEGIILGCTEIPLLIEQEDVSVPVFNTTEIHALAAVKAALN
jgi:aspartate racemase